MEELDMEDVDIIEDLILMLHTVEGIENIKKMKKLTK